MIKKAVLALIATLLILAVIFWETVAIQAAHAYLSYTCRHSLHAKFAADKLYFENGALVVEKPRILTKRELKEGGFRLVADRLVIQATPDFFQRKLDLAVGLQNPVFDIRQATSDMRFWLKETFQPIAFFSINAKLGIDKGVLAIHDSETVQSLYFKVEAEAGHQNRGHIIVSLDDPTLKSNCVTLSLARLERRHIALDLDLDNVEAAAFLKAMRNIMPDFDTLQFSEGRIKGKMALTFPKNGRPFAEGDLGFHEIVFAAPDFDLQGHIEEAHLHLNENPNVKDEREPRTIGHLEISREGSLIFEGPTQPLCAFQHIRGTLFFQTHDGARIALEGTCRHGGETTRLQIDGNAHFAAEGQGSLDLAVQVAAADQRRASAHFVTRQLGSKFKFVEFNFVGVGPSEFDLLQKLFTPYMTSMQIEMHEGTIDATALAYMRGLTITDLKVEKIVAKDLKLTFQPWEVAVAVDELSGELNVNCAAANLFETLNADLAISNSRIEFAGYDQTLCRLHNVQTQLTIRKGIVQKSLLHGEFVGLQGSIEIDGEAEDGDYIKATFEGGTQGLSNLAPEPFRRGFKTHFADDLLTLRLVSRPSPLGWLVEGSSSVGGETIRFGCDIELCSPQDWLLNLATKEPSWHELGAIASLAVLAEEASVSGMLRGFFLHDGWWTAQKLPLQKYLPLFLHVGEGMRVSGWGDFEGSFDHHSFLMNFDLTDLSVENSALRISLDGINRNGSYQLDFASGRWKGSLPVKNGLYLEKSSNLFFHDIKTEITCNSEMLRLNDLETQVEGVRWKGNLAVTYKDILNVAIHADEVVSTFSQMQKLFEHFQNLKFLEKLPLDGALALGEKGADLNLAFHLEGLKTEMKVGIKAEGELQKGLFGTFSNLSFKFDFDSVKDSIALSRIAGELILEGETLPARGEIQIGSISQGNGSFDLSLGEHARFVGYSHPLLHEDQVEAIQVIFDPSLTHLGTIHPSSIDLQLRPTGQVQRFGIAAAATMETILPELKFLARTKLIPLPDKLRQKVESSQASGNLLLISAYDDKNGTLTWQLKGNDLSLNGQRFERFLLEGKKRDNTWTIDPFQLDDLSLSMDIVRLSESWKVNFLGLRLKDSLLLGLEGEYRDGGTQFIAKVNLFELELDKLSSWNVKARGKFKGTGQLHVGFGSDIEIDTVLNGTLRSWSLCGLDFTDASNVSCHFVKNQGLTLRNLTTKMSSGADLLIEKGAYDFTNEVLTLEGLHFDMPQERAPLFAQQLQTAFPLWFNDKTTALISSLKQEGKLSGELHMHTSPKESLLKVVLGEGNYQFQGRPHTVHRAEVSYDLKTLDLFSHYRLDNHSFWVRLNSSDPQFKEGTLLFLDEPSPSIPPLTLTWKQDDVEGWTVQKAEGNFAGLFVSLRKDPATSDAHHAMTLVGEVQFDPTLASRLISEEAANKIKALQCGPGYTLKGRWLISKGSESFFDQLHFHGHLEGNSVVFKGYVWQNVNAEVDWIPGYVQLRKLKVDDPAGTFNMGTLTLARLENGLWVFEMPLIRAANFRPSLMKEADSPANLVSKPLLIKTLELENVTGYLHDSSSWKGKGKFEFTNPYKNHLQNTIFAIPAELLTLIGLDMRALNPVSGTIFMEVRDRKVMLTKFKDVYSEGKLSKFNLSNPSKLPSYMDFESNLHVQIRMKQYNLFFKLAELFTVNITGPVTKPIYSLHRQKETGKDLK